MASTEATNRYMTAKGYIESAKYIYTSPHRDNEHRITLTILPMAMLAGFALELLFKAWLLEVGRDSKSVRAFGHNVQKLYTEAKAEGLPAIDKLDQLVASLAPGHADFTFRYIDDGDKVDLINWEVAFPVLDALNAAVDTKVGASASFGLQPGH